tara:strand:+ start:904 stop:1443 length:540 start_codon:yes stop_codon:yes gene_type:complete
MAAIIALLVIALVLTGNKSESFVEMFGFSGHTPSKPIAFDKTFDASGYEQKTVSLTRNQMQKIIQGVMKEMNMCDAYPLETNHVHLLSKSGVDPIYRCQFTFMMNDGGFPAGVGVQTDVRLADDRAHVLGLTTQPVKVKTSIEPFNQSIGSEYSDFELVSKNNLPSVDALDTAKKSLYT